MSRLSSRITYIFIPLIAVAALFGSMPKAFAGQPYLDKGGNPDLNNFYKSVQQVPGTIFENRGIYGKLEGTTPIDVYSFTPDQDNSQSLSLLVRKDEMKSSTDPYLILIDPTTNTDAQTLGIPVPSSDYHTTVIKPIAVDQQQDFSEPAIMESYTVVSDQRIAFSKGKTYYVIVLDSDRTGAHFTHYVVRFGDAKAWSATDIVKHLGDWMRIKTDSFAGISPYHFAAPVVGFFILLLGLVLMIGTWVMFQIFNLLSSKSKTSAYLMVKLQPYTNVLIWVSLWFTALGGYMYFTHNSWSGLPFILVALFIPIIVVMLVDTLVLSPQIKQVEVSRKEASLPLLLRKKLFVTFVLNTVLIVTFVVLFTMQVVPK